MNKRLLLDDLKKSFIEYCSLFSLENEKKYKENNLLDYSLIDVSKIRLSKINIISHSMDKLKLKKDDLERELVVIQSKINIIKNNLVMIGEDNPLISKKLDNMLDILHDDETYLLCNLENLINRINDESKNIKGNYTYFKNYSIIYGIRDAICSDDFDISYSDDDILSSVIKFKARKDNKLYFGGSIKFKDFISLIDNCSSLVLDNNSRVKKC